MAASGAFVDTWGKKQTGLASTKALNRAEEAGSRESGEDNSGWVQVERRVRPYREGVDFVK